MMRAPDAPSGCPRAMAPPFTFIFAGSAPSSFNHASGTDANASLTSKRSMSSTVSPAFASSFLVAGIGAVSIIRGSSAARVNWTNRARGRSPSAAAFSSLMMRIAAEPSVICDELPAVTRPSGRNAGFSLARVSIDESGRMPSSFVISSPSAPRTGWISRSNRPSAVARAARWWLSAAKASMSSRERPHFSAMSSAEMP